MHCDVGIELTYVAPGEVEPPPPPPPPSGGEQAVSYTVTSTTKNAATEVAVLDAVPGSAWSLTSTTNSGGQCLIQVDYDGYAKAYGVGDVVIWSGNPGQRTVGNGGQLYLTVFQPSFRVHCDVGIELTYQAP